MNKYCNCFILCIFDSYMKLVKSVDGETYAEQNFSPTFLENFLFALVSTSVFVPEPLLKQMCIVRVNP